MSLDLATIGAILGVLGGGKCALGLCQGAGCVPAPCSHSEARDRCGGGNCLEPEECR